MYIYDNPELLQSCIDSRITIVSGFHHPPHTQSIIDLCSILGEYKEIRLGIEILPTSFGDASKEEKLDFYREIEVRNNYGFRPKTLSMLEYLPGNVNVFGLQRLPYFPSNGLINDFEFCRGYYKTYNIINKARLEAIFVEEIKNRDINLVLIGGEHLKGIYSAFRDSTVINQTCAALNEFIPFKNEIEGSFVVGDPCVA